MTLLMWALPGGWCFRATSRRRIASVSQAMHLHRGACAPRGGVVTQAVRHAAVRPTLEGNEATSPGPFRPHPEAPLSHRGWVSLKTLLSLRLSDFQLLDSFSICGVFHKYALPVGGPFTLWTRPFGPETREGFRRDSGHATSQSPERCRAGRQSTGASHPPASELHVFPCYLVAESRAAASPHRPADAHRRIPVRARVCADADQYPGHPARHQLP